MWPLEHGHQKKGQQKALRSMLHLFTCSRLFSKEVSIFESTKNRMYGKERVVDINAGWFINCPRGELKRVSFLLNLEVFSVEFLQKEGKV